LAKKVTLLAVLLLALSSVASANLDDDTYMDDDTYTDDDTWMDDDTWYDDDSWTGDDDTMTDDDTSGGDDDATDDDTADTGGDDDNDDNGLLPGCAVASGNPALPLTLIMLVIGGLALVLRRKH